MFNNFVHNSPAYTKETGNGIAVLLSYANGIVFGAGLMLFFFSKMFDFGIVIAFVSFFHFWEYTFVAIFRHQELTYHSFLFNHSKEYFYAFVTGFGEYFIELYFFPQMKAWKPVVYFGILIMFIGQSIRTLSMYTAASNFNHQIESSARKDHELVTHGIYGYLRHPSYFGWFWWCIAIQITLMNPISICTWSYASWYFFRMRIEYEESTLVEQFGEKYHDYAKSVPIGIPFIK